MTDAEILKHIDHTLLQPAATWSQIEALCGEAVKYGTATVCVPPAYVGRICAAFGKAPAVCTVAGFPLGYSESAAKAYEAALAVQAGAAEVDMVINIGDVKNGAFAKLTSEIAVVKKALDGRILKVIIETCYLTKDEKIALCRCVTEGGADYIKTSTGFGPAGANIEDVLLMRENVGPQVKVKAAGGIRSRGDMVAYLQAGCERLGTSSAIKILCGEMAGSY